MNDICLATRLGTARDESGAHGAGGVQPTGGEAPPQVYFQAGRRFMPADPAALNLREALPPGTYTIGINEKERFVLEQVEDFVLPDTLYGDVDANALRILGTFLARPSGAPTMP